MFSSLRQARLGGVEVDHGLRIVASGFTFWLHTFQSRPTIKSSSGMLRPVYGHAAAQGLGDVARSARAARRSGTSWPLGKPA